MGPSEFGSRSILLGGFALAALVSPAHAQFGNAWVSFEERPEFLAAPMISDIDNEVDFAWADLDKNGLIDLVVVRKEPFTTPGKRSNLLLMNEGGVLTDRTFEFASASDVHDDAGFRTKTNDRDVTIADLDLDGWLDVITATTLSDGDPKAVGHPRIYMNLGEDGGGNWLGLRYEATRIPQLLQFQFGTAVNPRFCAVTAGDVTGDGFPDLYFVDYDSGVISFPELPQNDLDDRLLVNDGNGFFTDQTQQRMTSAMVLSNFGTSAEIVDVNLDGTADILKSSALGPYVLAAVYNDPDDEGSFNMFDPFHDGLNTYHFDAGDLNNDGRPDVVMSQDSADRYRYNLGVDLLGRAIWGPPKVFTFLAGGDDGFASNNLIADLDGDGWNDVIICDVDLDVPGYNLRTHIYHNPGGAVGEQIQLVEEREAQGVGWLGAEGLLYADLASGHDVAVFDIDGDGDNDLILGRKDGTFAWRNTAITANAFVDIGNGLAGTHGVPSLQAEGTLAANDPFSLTLSGALENTTAWLTLGFAAINAPFKGGVLVPDIAPPGLVLPLPTGPTGTLAINDTWPAGVPSGFSLFVQYWVQDGAGLAGFAASNALHGMTL